MFHDVPNRKGGRGELERNTQINEKPPIHCSAMDGRLSRYSHSMVNIWFLLYMVDHRQHCYPYLAVLSQLYRFPATFAVKMRSQFGSGKLLLAEVF